MSSKAKDRGKKAKGEAKARGGSSMGKRGMALSVFDS